MKTLLILHGIGGKAGDHWEKWLHDKAQELGFLVIMPNLPNSNNPNRGEWLEIINNILSKTNLQNVVIVAHSLGVTSALDFLENSAGKIKALISISGFSEDYGSPLNSNFLKEKHINMEKVKENVENSYIFFGDDDPYVPQEVLSQLATDLKVTPVIISHGGHLNTDAGFTTFPQLVDILSNL